MNSDVLEWTLADQGVGTAAGMTIAPGKRFAHSDGETVVNVYDACRLELWPGAIRGI